MRQTPLFGDTTAPQPNTAPPLPKWWELPSPWVAPTKAGLEVAQDHLGKMAVNAFRFTSAVLESGLASRRDDDPFNAVGTLTAQLVNAWLDGGSTQRTPHDGPAAVQAADALYQALTNCRSAWLGGLDPTAAAAVLDKERRRPWTTGAMLEALRGPGVMLSNDSFGPTHRQRQYLTFIRAYIRDHRVAPTEQEVARAMGVSGPSAHAMLDRLADAGFITREPGVARGLSLNPLPQEQPVSFESYLARGVKASDAEAFFVAAHALFRSQPWERIPHDMATLRVDAPTLGVVEGVLSIIGQNAEALGIVLFESTVAFEAFVEMAEDAALGIEPEMTPQMALLFDAFEDLNPRQQAEIVQHGWPVSHARGCPHVMVVDHEGVVRGPDVAELRRVTVVATALAQLLADEPDLQNATTTVCRDWVVDDVPITLTFEPEPVLEDDEWDALSPQLSDSFGGFDPDRARAYKTALLEGFAASPEAAPFTDGPHWVEPFVDFSTDYLGRTVEDMDVYDAREILFEIFPGKVVASPDDAPRILSEVRALMGFVARTTGKAWDPAITAVLAEADGRLASALVDADRFGPATRWAMAGRAAGFDLDTPAGLDAWARASNGRSLGAVVERTPDHKKREKAKKKAQRTARKKNKKRR